MPSPMMIEVRTDMYSKASILAIPVPLANLLVGIERLSYFCDLHECRDCIWKAANQAGNSDPDLPSSTHCYSTV